MYLYIYNRDIKLNLLINHSLRSQSSLVVLYDPEGTRTLDLRRDRAAL